jgi:hypothetical protein
LNPSWLPEIVNRGIASINDISNLNIPELPIGEISAGQILIYFVFATCLTIVATRSYRTPILRRKNFNTPLERDENFRLESSKFVRLWSARLDSLDRELNWTDQDFIALEAEVETTIRRTWTGNIIPLVEALKDVAASKAAERPVIILGEPGSGKSVALRRLCRTLLRYSSSTGQIPIYISLKGWQAPNSWTVETKPNTMDLQDFVKAAILSEANDYFAERFINEYFDRILLEGRFFFIFDSFDEIPLVMDHPENSWAIDAVSRCLNNFLQGTHSSQGIVASRYFKKPSSALGAATTFRIRPFDERKIREILKVIGGQSEAAVLEAFRTKSTILRSATNPMIAHLLATYVRERHGRWPENTFQLYQDYIDRRLEDQITDQKLKEFGLDRADFTRTSSRIAQHMVDADSNTLDVKLEELRKVDDPEKIITTVAVLKFIRLGRQNSSISSSFSFSHRRFQEFFVASSMTESQVMNALSAIHSDNRYRDILALYCETATTEAMSHVATHTISLMESVQLADSTRNVSTLRSAVQVLRFISDALKNRPDLSPEFTEALKRCIYPVLRERSKGKLYPLLAKFSAETLGVLPDFGTSGPLGDALIYPNQYVRETAFRASRHIVPTPKVLRVFVDQHMIQLRYQRLTGTDFLSRFQDLRFSMRLSSGLRRERVLLSAWLIDLVLLPLSLLFLALIAPLIAILYAYALSKVTKGNGTNELLWAARFLSFLIVIPIIFAVTVVISFYLQYTGMTLEQVRSSNIIPSVMSFPLPQYFLKNTISPIPMAISLPLFLVLFVNLFFPLAPVIAIKTWNILNPQKVEIKPKTDASKAFGLRDIRSAWIASREASRKRRLEPPLTTSQPLTVAARISIGVALIFGLSAIFLWYLYGFSFMMTVIALVLTISAIAVILPPSIKAVHTLVSSAISDLHLAQRPGAQTDSG